MVRISVLLLLLAGCATPKEALLFPRGPGEQGKGFFDPVSLILTVDLNGARFEGRPITQTSYTSGIFARSATTTTNQESALLIGPAGQIRCEFSWGPWRSQANGTCVDRNNIIYDLLIRN